MNQLAQTPPGPAAAAPPRQPGTFQTIDEHGQTRLWNYRIDYQAARRVRDATGQDILKLSQPGTATFKQLTEDPYLLFDCMVAALQPQLDAAGLDADGLAGLFATEQVATDAAVALVEAVINFTQPAKRQALMTAWRRAVDLSQKAEAGAVQELNQMAEDGRLEKAIDAGIRNYQIPGE